MIASLLETIGIGLDSVTAKIAAAEVSADKAKLPNHTTCQMCSHFEECVGRGRAAVGQSLCSYYPNRFEARRAACGGRDDAYTLKTIPT